MSKVQVALPPKLIPLFTGEADVRAAHGGRGSGKTRSFAKMTAVRALIWDMAGRDGVILCARQFMNSLDDSSLEEIKAAIRSEPWLESHFEIGEKYVRTRSGRVRYVFAGLDRNISSIKSKARILLCWVDEAEPVSEQAWQTLIPTIREEDSELWVTWNPASDTSATHRRFRLTNDPLVKCVELNYRDNPKFPDILERQRQRDKVERPDTYDHIWEGAFVSVVEGAYFASMLTQAKAEGRIGNVGYDPLLTFRAFVDIGGTGARADAFVIWICQFVGKEIRVLNHYEAQGQPLQTHLMWMHEQGYKPGNTKFWLPHDGSTQDKVFDVSYESALSQAGYEVEVVPNQGKGAAKARIEAVRRKFPLVWFNETTTEAGRKALGWYHEKRDEVRGIGLGPNHDWASHSCFHHDTKVLTRYGTQRIMDLSFTGEVLTPCGWKQYINPRVTKKNAQLVEVVFVGGYSVKCTPDHLFLTVSGWKSAESLTSGLEIQSCLTNSRNTLKARYIGYGLLTSIFQRVAQGFTVMFGSLRLETSLATATFTTRTATLQTTFLKTLSAWTQKSITVFPEMATTLISGLFYLTKLVKKPLSGILRQKVENGTEGMLCAQSLGQSGNERKKTAYTVKSLFRRLFGKAETIRSIARQLARLLHIESVAKGTSGRLLIDSVKKTNETCDVWDITVPGVGCFSLENGATVHNCDAFGLVCIVHDEPTISKGPIKRRVAGIV